MLVQREECGTCLSGQHLDGAKKAQLSLKLFSPLPHTETLRLEPQSNDFCITVLVDNRLLGGNTCMHVLGSVLGLQNELQSLYFCTLPAYTVIS